MTQKKTLILHVGMGKTGTTALQEFFWANRKPLTRRGIGYPETGATSAAHHLVSPHVPPFLAHTGWRFLAPEEWIGAVAARPEPRILMSSELIAWGDAEKVAAFCAALAPHFDVKVCFYLRRQDNIIMAGYNQQLKAGTQTADLTTVLEKQIRRFDYLAKIWPWENAVGAENLIVLPYERGQFLNGDLIHDFMSKVLGIDDLSDFTFPKGDNANPRFSRAAMEFKRLVNNLITDPADSNRFNAPLFAFSEAQDKDSSKAIFLEQDTLTADQRDYVLRMFAPANEYIARKFVGRADGILFHEELKKGSNKAEAAYDTRAEMQKVWDHLDAAHPRLTGTLRDLIPAALANENRALARAAGLLDDLSNGKAPAGAVSVPARVAGQARRIIIHPGLPKTGTTAIQQAFYKNRNSLRRDHGILYPAIDENHTKPVLALFRADAAQNIRFAGMDAAAIDTYRSDAQARLDRDLAATDWTTLVLSGEGIMTLKPQEWTALAGWLESRVPGHALSILFAMREPVEWTRSAIQQNIKAGYRLEDQLEHPPVMNMKGRIAPLVRQFGREAVHLWNFDAAARSATGILDGFTKAAGLPASIVPMLEKTRINKNESLTAPAVTAIAERNRKTDGQVPLGAIEMARMLAMKGDRFTLPEDTVARVRDQSAEDLRWLDEHFPGSIGAGAAGTA